MKLSIQIRAGITMLSTWLGVYPLLTFLAWLLEPALVNQHLFVKTLVMSLFMVPLMVLVITPKMQQLTTILLNQENDHE